MDTKELREQFEKETSERHDCDTISLTRYTEWLEGKVIKLTQPQQTVSDDVVEKWINNNLQIKGGKTLVLSFPPLKKELEFVRKEDYDKLQAQTNEGELIELCKQIYMEWNNWQLEPKNFKDAPRLYNLFDRLKASLESIQSPTKH